MLARIVPLSLIASLVLFAGAPLLIAQAPYESTMGLIQKIFYFHVPAALTMFVATYISGIASIRHMAKGSAASDRVAEAAAELVVVFGLIVLITGPLWARKAWGVWWQWDAKLTSSLVLWLTFVGYVMLRRFGGPGSERLGAVVALFGMVNVPFVYWSVNIWRTLHPKTTVVPSLGLEMGVPFWWSMAAFLCLLVALIGVRVRLAEQEDALDMLLVDTDDAT